MNISFEGVVGIILLLCMILITLAQMHQAWGVP